MRDLPIVAAIARVEPPPSQATFGDLEDGDLHDLLVAFYATVGADPLLAPYFSPLDMAAHMPRIVAFWSTMVFQTRRYSGYAFKPHLEMPGLTSEHFLRWMSALETTVDAQYRGPNAEQMKALGHRVAYSMQLRLDISPFAAYRADTYRADT